MERCGDQSFSTIYKPTYLDIFMSKPPQDILTSRKLMTDSARNFTSWGCTEMLCDMSSTVRVPKEKIRSSMTTGTLNSHPSSYCTFFFALGLILGNFQNLLVREGMDRSIFTDYLTRYAVTKSLATTEVEEVAKFL
ncbi:hypothetical protein TNIN_129771 [Trichonephila inaurata madagascariensis]|uniref:Uncharacterized protein n=1 Tax=Trichonephila inaurata madagascariensis TaxID=2747483 RepID=A0A8X6IAQ6_9ARAC|nr:hypothetical protein TNIN_129771 [Trichonephila inaurata madagascariensis]